MCFRGTVAYVDIESFLKLGDELQLIIAALLLTPFLIEKKLQSIWYSTRLLFLSKDQWPSPVYCSVAQREKLSLRRISIKISMKF